MNIRVEAGPITLGLTTQMVEPTVKVELKAIHSLSLRSTWTCFSLPTISVNGHSLKSINPELKVGELATSLA
jgi:hypothetical protein